MPNKEDKISYGDLRSTIKQMKSTTDMYAGIVEKFLDDDGFDVEATRILLTELTQDDIKFATDANLMSIIHAILKKNTETDLTPEEITKEQDAHIEHLLEDHYVTTSCNADNDYAAEERRYAKIPSKKVTRFDTDKHEKILEEIREKHRKYYQENKEMLRGDMLRSLILTHKNEFSDIDEGYKKCDSLKMEAEKSLDEYVQKVTSDEVYEAEEERLNTLQTLLQQTSPDKADLIESYQDEIDALEAKKSHKYLYRFFERFDEKKSCDRIVNNFFDAGKSRYTIKRATEKMVKLGYDENVYRAFISIEERYLPKEYHPYNNLFLYFVLDFISYADVEKKEDGNRVRSIISQLGYLTFNKFVSEKVKGEFIGVITGFLDHFTDYEETFIRKNASAPTHPERIERTKKKQEEIHAMIFANMEDEGYQITDELRAMDLDDLKVFYDGWLETMEKEKKSKAKTKVNDIIESLKLNTEGHARERLKVRYMACAEWTEPMDQVFNEKDLKYLEDMVHEEERKAAVRQRELNLAAEQEKKEAEDKTEEEIFYDVETTNASFLSVSSDLEEQGYKNSQFMLRLINKDLVGVNPHDLDLDAETKTAIIRECKNNFWYFLREIMQVELTTGTAVQLFSIGKGINTRVSTRSNSDIVNYFAYKLMYGDPQSTYTVLCKSRQDAEKFVGELVDAMLLGGAIDQMIKVNDNDPRISYNVTKNELFTKILDDIKSKDAAISLGRGLSSEIVYYDNVTADPYVETIIDNSSAIRHSIRASIPTACDIFGYDKKDAEDLLIEELIPSKFFADHSEETYTNMHKDGRTLI